MTNEPKSDAETILQRMHARAVRHESHGDVPQVGSDEILAALRSLQSERDDLTRWRALEGDVRACARFTLSEADEYDEDDEGMRMAARRTLTALDSMGGKEPKLDDYNLDNLDDPEERHPRACRYCRQTIQHKLQCPGWPGQYVHTSHTNAPTRKG